MAAEYRSPGYRGGVLGFFSFTEVTDPSAHEAYNAWHQLDHLPEQFTLDGTIAFVCPACKSLDVEVMSGEDFDVTALDLAEV